MRGSLTFACGLVAVFGWSEQVLAQSAPPGASPSAATALPPTPAAPPVAAPVAALPADAPTAAPRPAARAEPRRAAPSRVAVVSFTADDPDAVLETDWSPRGGSAPMYMICSTPCEMQVSGDARYRVAGPGLYESTLFGLPPGRERVTVKAEMVSKSVAGPVLMLVLGGTAFTIVGPILLIAGTDANRRHKEGDGLIVSGAIVTLGGAALGLVGLVSLVLKSSQRESKVHVARAARPALTLPGGLAVDARGLRF